MPSTSDDWEELAKTEPFWAVATCDANVSDVLDEKAKEAFFRSGEEHIEYVLSEVRRRLEPGFAPRNALDFGCGVGRLVLPLAQRCEAVTGMDVSPTMLELAKQQVLQRALQNVTLTDNSALPSLRGTFDLVHSVAVIQHIPPAVGWPLLDQLVAALAPGGVGVLQLHLRMAGSSRDRWKNELRTRLKPARLALATVRRAPRRQALVLMHEYTASEVLWRLTRAGARDISVDVQADADRKTAATFYFTKG